MDQSPEWSTEAYTQSRPLLEAKVPLFRRSWRSLGCRLGDKAALLLHGFARSGSPGQLKKGPDRELHDQFLHTGARRVG